MEMTTEKDVGAAKESGQIVVSSKTLGLISTGIYRSPASALKELVSNAFDADAQWVEVSMNPPRFDAVSVTDNGAGIMPEKFLELMRGQIGDSDKRAHGDRTAVKGRPLIGRIGIGLLAIAQICHGFEVVSHHKKSRQAFRALVQISDDMRDNIDEIELDGTNGTTPKLDIGTYEVFDIEFDERRCGTSIIATDLKYGFLRRILRSTPATRVEGNDALDGVGEARGVSVESTITSTESAATPETPPPLPPTFEGFFDAAVRHNSLREISEYWRTTWGIALAAPIPYLNGGPVRGQPVNQERQEALKSYDFNVLVDGLSLRRPILLPPRVRDQRLTRDVHVETLHIDSVIDGVRLQGQGYIYSQGGKSIYPAELRGMLIRIKGVAIGDYDRNFLDYPYVEGPRYSWLSGEFDIEEGLEDALNIDRDSFNQAHPHYLEVQALIHGAMDRHVRPWLYRNLDIRRKDRAQATAVARQEALNETVAHILPNAHIERINKPLPQTQEQESFVTPVRIDEHNDSIEVNEVASAWPRSHRNRELAQEIAIGFEFALLASTPNEMRRRFYEYLKRVL